MLREIERLMREGVLPDPRTRAGLIVYSVIGFAIGFWIGGLNAI